VPGADADAAGFSRENRLIEYYPQLAHTSRITAMRAATDQESSMTAVNLAHRVPLLTALLFLSVLAPVTVNADVYDEAVAQSGRSRGDLERDPIDHPAEVLRLAGIHSGMQVADILSAGGYNAELLSYIVGPSGHVFMLNNAATDNWSGNYWKIRLANNRLPNVEHQTIDIEHLPLPDRSLDAEVFIKDYHDLYWIDDNPKTLWPRIRAGKVLDELARVLKPGGILLVVDHSAKPGTGRMDAQRLHRIDEAYARADFEKHGFEFVSQSDVLRRPDDKRDQISYKPPMLGKTDRFVLVFHRRA
jgi:predicted methyltransferase